MQCGARVSASFRRSARVVTVPACAANSFLSFSALPAAVPRARQQSDRRTQCSLCCSRAHSRTRVKAALCPCQSVSLRFSLAAWWGHSIMARVTVTKQAHMPGGAHACALQGRHAASR
jgi:hypothetical protein